MKERLIIDDTSIYEIDEECLFQKNEQYLYGEKTQTSLKEKGLSVQQKEPHT